jgi:hypothetical protein
MTDPKPQMPYEIEMGDSYLLVRFEDGTRVTPDMVLSVLREEFNLPKEKVICDLWDLRGCHADKTIDASMMIQFVSYIKDRYHSELMHRKTAILVDKDVAFGLTRMFQILAEDLPYEVEIFRDEHEAQRWVQS